MELNLLVRGNFFRGKAWRTPQCLGIHASLVVLDKCYMMVRIVEEVPFDMCMQGVGGMHLHEKSYSPSVSNLISSHSCTVM
jgi:hypothetical protein